MPAGSCHARDCSVVVRRAAPSDSELASDLVRSSFRAVSSANWSQAASAQFLEDSSPENMRDRLASAAFAALATASGMTAGFILMSRPTILSMLFVHPDWLRRGVGRTLWEAAREHTEGTHARVTTIELNSTTYALPFYRSLGFMPISGSFEINGARATRMACWLPARALGALPG